MPLVFIVGLQAEARLLDFPTFIGTTEIGADATALVSFGLAGGLSPSLAAGALIVPRCVLADGRRYDADPALSAALGGFSAAAMLAGDAVAARATEKARLWSDTGAEAIDLESGAVAQAATAAGVPFAVLRAVCDPAWRDLPPAALAALDGAGAIGIGRVMASLLRHPGQLGGLLALARDAARARTALKDRLAILRRSGALSAWL